MRIARIVVSLVMLALAVGTLALKDASRAVKENTAAPEAPVESDPDDIQLALAL